MSDLLFRALVGSRLYGLDHKGSDYDYLEVYGWSKQRPIHTVTDTVDVLQVSFSDFMKHANAGGPKFVEAMFLDAPEVSKIESLRNSWRPSLAACRVVYNGLILEHWEEGVEKDILKKRRHAIRMYLNLSDLEEKGRFNPTLSPKDLATVKELAEDISAGSVFLNFVVPKKV